MNLRKNLDTTCLLNFVILRPPIYTFIVSLYGKPQFDLSYLYANTINSIVLFENR